MLTHISADCLLTQQMSCQYGSLTADVSIPMQLSTASHAKQAKQQGVVMNRHM